MNNSKSKTLCFFTVLLSGLAMSGATLAASYDSGQYYTATDVANYQNNLYSDKSEKSEGLNIKQKTNPFTGKTVNNMTIYSRSTTKNLLK
jgi:hypothetical protein